MRRYVNDPRLGLVVGGQFVYRQRVGRGVIDDDDLSIGKALFQDAINRLVDVYAMVMAGDNGRYEWKSSRCQLVHPVALLEYLKG